MFFLTLIHMNFFSELELLIKARYPIIYIPTIEEERLEFYLQQFIKTLKDRSLFAWNFADGYYSNPNDLGFGAKNPLQALELIEKTTSTTKAIFLLKDFDHFLNDLSVSRKLKNLAHNFKTQSKTIIISAPQANIPLAFKEEIYILEFTLPTLEEIKKEVTKLSSNLGQNLEDFLLDTLAKSCQGLSLERIRRVLSKVIYLQGVLSNEALSLILQEKKQIIKETQILEFYENEETLLNIGGLENLKKWLIRRKKSFSDQAQKYGLKSPKGLLLIGIQGTGKSLSAKVIANEWQLPLLRLDVGKLFAGIVGESESRIRQMIQLTESLSPCILWIDEIEKAFGGIYSKGDSGITSRIFGTFITWLSEKNSPVFVVATANNIEYLPNELLRKGRFDEIFFIGLPVEEERREIFQVHLSQIRQKTWKNFDIDKLAKLSKNFSGAEIEQVIIEAMYDAFSHDREFTTEDICNAINHSIPLAYTEKERINKIQEWAASGKVRLASKV
uniref:Uncharacterized AAA domain-containing protein ycf46 n=1 Tax=Sciadococcus taiwanensis TaxID=3028030 RepID=A0A9Y1MWX1_9RHOD|nr:AAA family ATPase [Sciadococcus taiwanensis]